MINSLDKLSKQIDKASENYVNATSFRVGVAAIPGIGGSLDILFSSRGNELIFRRINFFLKFLEEFASKLDEDKIDKKFLETEDWFDLVYKSFDEVRKTRVEEKQRLFAKILSNSSLNIDETENVELYIRITSELSLIDIKILNHLYENIDIVNSDEHKVYSLFWKEINNKLKLEEDKKKLSLYKLFSLGLITERYGAIMGYGGGNYKTTLLLSKYLNFIRK